MLSPCLFNFYAEYIMRNARLDEAQTGIKIAGRNINKLRYTDDTILMAESEEELRTGLPGAPQDEAGLTRKFETSHVGGATGRTPQIGRAHV